jgi:glutamine synthetase
MDKNLYDLEPEELGNIQTLPASLEEALNNLEDDHEFLLKGGVFSEDLVEAWISYKRNNEVDAIRVRPHPHEFFMYYDV